MALSFSLNNAERAYLSRVARLSIESVLAGKAACAPEPPAGEDATATGRGALRRALGAFVTLSLGGDLRGCMGVIAGREPLFLNVWRMARAAAFEDPRFPPLHPREWPETAVRISVLDELTPCPDPQAVEVGRHGLLLRHMGRSGVFLPQVPVEQGWDRATYLERLCAKAGLPGDSWRAPGARLFWYEALAF
ncbi:AmmeMemoRadiSam system protein A [Desulfovibrio sp. SGI.169]|uniref:AmmeMemoRadiSam system protein A n=1 Tax=Desulfovibrio sp. SGI.169 TaxID=3420561 RepID=UPI003D00A6E5